jgi:hypothetical protein
VDLLRSGLDRKSTLKAATFNSLLRGSLSTCLQRGGNIDQRATEPGIEPEHEFAPQGGLNGQALWHPEKANR